MSFTAEKREEIKFFLLDLINNQDKSAIQKTVEEYQISSTSVKRYLKMLLDSKIIEVSSESPNGYDLIWKEYEYRYDILEVMPREHEIYEEILAPLVSSFTESARIIWPYAFGEMMNNAIEHSGATRVICKIRTSYLYTDIILADNGRGIFKQIQDYIKRETGEEISTSDIIMELYKGKLTIAKNLHFGEGIFFVSKMLDYFAICSDKQVFSRGVDENDKGLQNYLKSYANRINGYGTTVWMELSNHTERNMQEVFDAFLTEESGLTKTTIPIREICRAGYPVSRSLARQLVYRMEEFKDIILDFSGVPMIGQGFAHEVFVVFQNKYPDVHISAIHTNENVKKMIHHVLA